MTGPDQIDKRSFSVRWTGQLNVPANGRYTFSPFTSIGADGVMKLWINNQLILDTSITNSESETESSSESTSTTGNSVPKTSTRKESPKSTLPVGVIALTVGQPADFRLEYVRSPIPPKREELRKLSAYPAAVLAWRSEVMERQIIPPNVFTPPQEMAKEVKQGLKGEYFADITFQKRVALRVDPNIDFIWDVGRIASEYRDSQREIASAVVTKVTSSGYLTSLSLSESKDFVQKQLPPLFAVMSVSERITVLKAIVEQPDLLKLFTFPQLAGAIRWCTTQEESDMAIDLLVKWSKNVPAPIAQPGFIPGRSPGGYLIQNVEPYYRLARLFLGTNAEKNIEILSNHIVNEDGTCNLTIAYILACICRATNHSKILADITDSRLLGKAVEQLSGDAKASWRILEAFKYETVYGNEFQPGLGLMPIEKALEEAESPEMRFRVIGELAARLIASDRTEEAQSLIMSIRDQFPNEDKQLQLDSWLERGTKIKEYYEKLRAETVEEQDTFIINTFTKELKRRVSNTEKLGTSRTLQRYQQSLRELEEVQAKKQKNIQDK
jgi:hypothetical protein